MHAAAHDGEVLRDLSEGEPERRPMRVYTSPKAYRASRKRNAAVSGTLGDDMQRTKLRLTRLLTASVSVALAGWLLHVAGDWPRATSLSQFFVFMFCMLGIDRVL